MSGGKKERKKIAPAGVAILVKLFFYNPDHDNDKLTWKSIRKIKIKL